MAAQAPQPKHPDHPDTHSVGLRRAWLSARLPPGPRLRQRLLRQRPEDHLPLPIRHERIYILPTRRGWAFLGVLLIMLLASINYALSLGYALSFLFTGLFSACLLHTYRNLAGLVVDDARGDDTFAGQPTLFHLRLRNPGPFARFGIDVRTARGRTRVDVPGVGSSVADLGGPTGHRGLCPLGRVTLSSDYPLGLWRSWSYVHAPVQALVYPAPQRPAPELPPGRHETPHSGVAQRDTQGDIAGVRPYQPGDALNTIAWKSAARGLGLQVRQHEQPRLGGEPWLSLEATGEARTEAALSRLTAWVLSAETAGMDYGFALGPVQLAAGHGPQQRKHALQALALYPDGRAADGPAAADSRPMRTPTPPWAGAA